MKLTDNRIREYLNSRGLTDEVIETSGLSYESNTKRIVIPIFNWDGSFLFNKYRRDPDVHDGPKYMYEPGTSSALYGAHTLNKDVFVDLFIVEGEFDALRLQAEGLHAVSTTGGSGTFNPEWIEKLKNEYSIIRVFICYDNDPAGWKGSYKLQTLIPEAKVVLFDDEYANDISEYFKNHTKEQFLECVKKSESYYVWQDEFDSKKLAEQIGIYSDRRREMIMDGEDVNFLTVVIAILTSIYGELLREEKFSKRKSFPQGNGDKLQRAKSVPITDLLKFNSSGFTECIWHTEKSASLKYYPKQNKVHCFGCAKSADSIDVVMQKDSLTFKEAVEKLIGPEPK